VERKHLVGLLHPIPIPKWKWEVISMDFITGFLKTSRKHYFIMVLVNKLTKASHFILVKSTNSTSVAAEFFIRGDNEIAYCSQEDCIQQRF